MAIFMQMSNGEEFGFQYKVTKPFSCQPPAHRAKAVTKKFSDFEIEK
jgi:hypothetical protein